MWTGLLSLSRPRQSTPSKPGGRVTGRTKKLLRSRSRKGASESTRKMGLGQVAENGASGRVTEKGASHLLHGDLYPITGPEPMPLGQIDIEPQGIRILGGMLL